MYTCHCISGYTGNQCETSKSFRVLFSIIIFSCLDIDDCASWPCNNGGRCIDEIDSFTCQCLPGFTGVQCETSESLLVSDLLTIGLNVILVCRY